MKRVFLVFMLCILGLISPLKAQETVTIGSGTERSSTVPFDMWNAYGVGQLIYTADEINHDAGSIESMALKFYNVTGFDLYNPVNGASPVTRNLEIYLANTDITNIDRYQVMNGEPLFQGSMTFNNNDWTTFEFDTPFEYTGGNLLVTVLDVTGYSAGNDYYPFFVYEYDYSDNSQSITSAPAVAPVASQELDYITPMPSKSQIQLTFGNGSGNQGGSNGPVFEVLATQANSSSVDVVWSWNDIVPQTVIVNFETGDLTQADFKNDMNYPWVITEDAYEGSYAIKSTNQGQQDCASSIEITVDVPNDGTMSFYHKISCEYYFDNGRFYIDGVERSLVTDKVDWEYKEFQITKGQHTYRWSFQKDESDYYSTGEDTYYVDNIVLYTPEEEFDGGWIYYDDGNYVQSVGPNGPEMYWAISFPNTEKYAGYTLTKIAHFDQNAAFINAMVRLGGETPNEGELVAEQLFTCNGTKSMVEFQLSEENQVYIDGTKPLWIVLASADWFPGSVCNYVNNPNSDWYSEDGTTWTHLADNPVFRYSWILRGYLENERGEVLSLSNERGASDATGYNLYRTNTLTEETETLATNVSDTTYKDNEWSSLEYGIYQWGVSALYGTNESETVWSNAITKDMYTTVEVNVTTNSGDAPKNAKVQFVNTSEPGMGFDYKVRLDESGHYVWNKFRRGTYEYTIALEGYESCAEKETITITDGASLECTLTEIAADIDNLYVSPTGYAMWQPHDFDNGGGEFFYDFDNGTLEGWRTIDADGDGFNWGSTSQLSMLPGNGYNNSKYCVTSASLGVVDDTLVVALTPNNFMVTENAYLMVEDSQLTYYVKAQDKQYPAEHYGVAVATVENATAEDFTMLWEETLVDDVWAKRTIDLGQFAGQELYIAFRHFGSTDQYRVNIDDARLVNNGKKSRAVESYTVMLNGEVVAENVTDTFYQHENITAGTSYTTTVIANYTSDASSEGASCTWTAAACDEYVGVESFNATMFGNKAILKWRMEGDEEQSEFESSFYSSFNDGNLSGWTTIDADGDGYNWCSSDSVLGPEYGYNGYKDGLLCAMSASYSGVEMWPLTPDNYLVTPVKYYITENSQLSFVVCAQDPGYPEEHYGVAISMVGNTDAKDFVTIWEETIAKDDPDMNTPQTDWKGKIVDLSAYAGQEVYIAFRHFNCTGQYFICLDDVELMSGERNDKRSEIIGFNVYCNNELISREAPTSRGLQVEFPGDEEYEYCVRVVYSDYAMSCPECATLDAPMICQAPEDLYAEEAFNENGESGIQLTWPYEAPAMSEWIYYDDNTPVTAIGLGGTMYWGILFPAESLGQYNGTSLSKVKVYDAGNETGEGTILICYGTLLSPGDAVTTQNFDFTGEGGWLEIDLDNPVEINGQENVWVLIFQHGMNHPAVVAADCGDYNARWISADGMQWQDLGAFGAQYELTFMIRAFVTNEFETEANATRELFAFGSPEVNPAEVKVEMSDKPVFAPRATEFDHYNVYRGPSEYEFELLATTTEGYYFDTDVKSGETYYYQVKAVYVDGEDDCESEAANSFYQPSKNYVVVEYLSIGESGVNGMMIYPNPTKDNLTIKAEDMKRITIVNTMGQVIYDQEVMSDSKDINMSQFESGVYMVRITTENGVATQRVTVVK